MYEDWTKRAGIYRIWLSPIHYYIGRASNCRIRWMRHLRELNKKTHPNAHMQSIFNIRGEFTPEVVVSILPNTDNFIVDVEQQWLDEHYGNPNCVNTCKSAIGVMTGRKMAEETRLKMIGRKISPEAIKKTADALRGRKRSPETVKKVSESLKGIKRPYTADRNRESAGWHHTEEAKEKISEAGRRPCPDSVKLKISAALKAAGIKPPGRSGPVSEETRARLAKLRIGAKDSEETRKKKSDSIRLSWVKRKAKGK